MAWQFEITEMVRGIVGDFSDDPEYCDSRVAKAIILAAQQLLSNVKFCREYTINYSQLSIVPDPTEDPRDNDFINMLVLKTASLIISSELRKHAASSISITDGPSSISAAGVFANTKKLADDIDKKLDTAILQLKLYGCGGIQDGAGNGSAVLGPITNTSIYGRFL